jgi:hypothetical protein
MFERRWQLKSDWKFSAIKTPMNFHGVEIDITSNSVSFAEWLSISVKLVVVRLFPCATKSESLKKGNQ